MLYKVQKGEFKTFLNDGTEVICLWTAEGILREYLTESPCLILLGSSVICQKNPKDCDQDLSNLCDYRLFAFRIKILTFSKKLLFLI